LDQYGSDNIDDEEYEAMDIAQRKAVEAKLSRRDREQRIRDGVGRAYLPGKN